MQIICVSTERGRLGYVRFRGATLETAVETTDGGRGPSATRVTSGADARHRSRAPRHGGPRSTRRSQVERARSRGRDEEGRALEQRASLSVALELDGQLGRSRRIRRGCHPAAEQQPCLAASRERLQEHPPRLAELELEAGLSSAGQLDDESLDLLRPRLGTLGGGLQLAGQPQGADV